MLPRHRPFSSCEDEDAVDADEEEGESVDDDDVVVTINVLSRERVDAVLFLMLSLADPFSDNRFTSSSMADEFVVLK